MNIFSTLLLAAVAAAPASAQVVRVATLAAPVNPVMGLPKSLPSPLAGPLAGVGISLPTVSGAPVVALAAAPAAAPAALPVSLPAPAAPLARRPALVGAVLPTVTMDASRENKRNPFRSLLPDPTARLGEKDRPQAEKGSQEEQDRLDELFDGNGQVARRRAPLLQPSRRHSLPEWDLEDELGLGR